MWLILQLSVAVTLCSTFFVPSALCDFINEDIQIVAQNATNFEILLRGNRINQLSDRFISPFNNGAQVNFNNANNTTTIVFNAFGGQKFGVGVNHFGFALSNAAFVEGGVGEGVIAKLISFDNNPPPRPDPIRVPAVNLFFQNNVANNGEIRVTLQNLSVDTIDLSQVGYLVTSAPFALEDLNRTTLPPSAFNNAGIFDGTQLIPGDVVTFNVPASFGQYITVFTDSKFGGVSSANPYGGLVGAWVETQVVPEPNTLALLLAGLCVIGAAALKRSATIRIGWLLPCCLIYLTLVSPVRARADAIPLHEEYVLAQQIHVDASWENVVLNILRNDGLYQPGAAVHYDGTFQIAPDQLSGTYSGALSGTYLGDPWMIGYSAEMTVDSVTLSKTWKLKSTGSWVKPRDRALRGFKDSGTIVENADNTADFKLTIETDGSPKISTVTIAGTLKKVKGSGHLIADGEIDLDLLGNGNSEKERVLFDLDQEKKTFVSAIASKGVSLVNNGSFSVNANLDGSLSGATSFDLVTIPEPRVIALLATSLVVFWGNGWLRLSSLRATASSVFTS